MGDLFEVKPSIQAIERMHLGELLERAVLPRVDRLHHVGDAVEQLR